MSKSFNHSSITKFYRLWLCKLLIALKTLCATSYCFDAPESVNHSLCCCSSLGCWHSTTKAPSYESSASSYIMLLTLWVLFLFFSIWTVTLHMSFSTHVTPPCTEFVISHCLRTALHIRADIADPPLDITPAHPLSSASLVFALHLLVLAEKNCSVKLSIFCL